MSDLDDHALLPAFHENSPENNHAAWVIVTSLIFLILSIVVTGAKILYRFRITGLKLYDALIIVAAVRLLSSFVLTDEER